MTTWIILLGVVALLMLMIGFVRAPEINHHAPWVQRTIMIAAAFLVLAVVIQNHGGLAIWALLGLIIGIILYLVLSGAAAVLILVLVMSLILLGMAAPARHSTNKATSATTTTTVPTKKVHVQAAAPGQACANGYPVILDKNQGHRILSKGLHGVPSQMVKQYLAAAKHDPRALVNVYNPGFHGQSPPINLAEVAKGGCYTLAGIEAYSQLKGAFASPMSKVTASSAPAHGVNTGANPGGANFAEAPGAIGGNRSGIMVTFPNGNTFWIMKRCGNVVTKAPPSTSTMSSTSPTTPSTTSTGGKHDSQSSLYNPKVPNKVKGCGQGGAPSGHCPSSTLPPPSPISTFTNTGSDGYQKGHSPNKPPVTTTTQPRCEYRAPDGTCTSRPVTTAPPVNVGGGTPTTNAPIPSSG